MVNDECRRPKDETATPPRSPFGPPRRGLAVIEPLPRFPRLHRTREEQEKNMRSATLKALLAAVLLWTIAADRSAAASRDVWLLSTRNVCDGCAGVLESQPLQVWRLEDECRWADADLAGDAAERQPGRAHRNLRPRLRFRPRRRPADGLAALHPALQRRRRSFLPAAGLGMAGRAVDPRDPRRHAVARPPAPRPKACCWGSFSTACNPRSP